MIKRILGFAAFGGMLLALFVCCGEYSSVSANSKFTVNLDNGVSIRVVDKTGETPISNLDLTVLSTPGGAFVSDSFNVEVSTANTTGYKLYMTTEYKNGDNFTTGLVNVDDNTYEIPTLSANMTKTNMSKSDGSAANLWGYSLDDTTYKPAPAHTTNDQVGGNTTAVNKELVPIYVATNIDMSKPSGTYQSTLVFSAIPNAPSVDYTLSFDMNGGSKLTGKFPDQTGSSQAGQYDFTLPTEMPYKIGNGFLGWSEDSSAVTATYHPGDTYTMISQGSGAQTKTLYAIWGTADFYNIASMQQMSSTVCSSVYTPNSSTGDNAHLIGWVYDGITAYQTVSNLAGYQSLVPGANTANVAQRVLYDIRDSNLYTVRKLADGNCWMTSNLKYSLSANSTRVGVNHSTNQTFEFNAGSACSGNENCIMNGNTVMTEQVTNGGYYYSWYAATAGTGTASMASGDATGSICPKGWRLPANYSSDSNKSYGSITEKYLGFHVNTSGNYVATMEAIPLQFLRAGFYGGGTFSNGGTSGVYWSSTASTAANGYHLTYFTGLTYPQNSSAKYYGYSVRCVNN